MKKILAILLCLSLIFVFAACSSGSSSNAPAASQSNAGTELPKVTWRFASQSGEEVLATKICREAAEEVSKRTNGGFTIKVYANRTLGSDREITESVQAGTIESGVCTYAVLSNFAPLCGVTDLPYLITSWDMAKKFMSSEPKDKIDQALADVGVQSLGPYCYGFRQFTNNVRPIETLDDFKGIKLRVMQSDIFTATFKALGAYPVGMAMAEVHTALQQHTIDGQENPMEIIYKEKLQEIQKYISLTKHSVTYHCYIANPKAVEALPEEYRKVLFEVYDEYRFKITDELQAGDEEFAQKLQDEGMQLNVVSDENIGKFREVCQKEVWPQFQGKYGTLVDDILKL